MAENGNSSYNDSSIELLKGATRIRTRPASMLGSSGLDGARHGFIEIYGNALDEHSAGYGDKLDVIYHEDNSITVRDYGRGVPLGWNDNPSVRNWNWHVIYNELYGGGKYNTNQEELRKVSDWSGFDPKQLNYLFSVGLNGLGAAATQYTSEFFEVKSFRDGVCTSRSFKEGVPLVDGKQFDMFSATQEEIEAIPEEKSPTTEANGTYIHWKPDSKVFSDVNIGGDWLYDTCKDIADVGGIELHFVDEQKGIDITLERGTTDTLLLNRVNSNKVSDDASAFFKAHKIDHGEMRVEDNPHYIWVCDCNIAFTPVINRVSSSCYHNSVKMKSGVQYGAIENAVEQFFVQKGRAQGIKLKPNDYADSLCFVVSTYSNYASFRNQTKDAVDDNFIYKIVFDMIIDTLNTEYAKGNKYIKAVVDSAVEKAENRIALEEMQQMIKQTAKVQKQRTPDKFVSCDAYEKKNYNDVELWITEGDSAKGSVKDARSAKFQAIYPIRGKGLNVAKASMQKILENKEIREMFAILGTSFDVELDGQNMFNMDDLKVGKIIFATDADEDGYQIRVLLFLTFYKLAPELLRQGKVFIAETPRFGITTTDGVRHYCKDDDARDKFIETHQGKIRKIDRYKGLGEVNADVLRETTVHPDSRNLIPVTVDLDNESERELIDALFGADKYSQRKAIISEALGHNVVDLLDDMALALQAIDDSEIEEGIEYEEVG